MRGLVLLVVGVADEHAAQAVESDFSVRFGVHDGRALGRGLEHHMVGFVAVQGPGDMAAQHELLQAVHHGGQRQAFFEPVFEVAVFVQLGVQPAGLESGGVGVQLIMCAPGNHSLVSGFASEHAGFDGGVAAFDAADVQKPGIAADQRTAGEHGLGQGVQATGVNGACAIRNALAVCDAFGRIALQIPAHIGMGLPTLEFLKRAEVGVGVAQAGNKAHGHFVALQVVEEGAAVGHFVHGPSGRMHDKARLVARRVNFPHFFDADAKALRIFAGVQLVFGNHLLAQVAARTFGKNGVFAQQLHAQLEAVARGAFFADAHIARRHAFDRAFVVVQHLCRSKAREDFHAQGLGLLCEPAGDIAQADDVIAMVVGKRRQQKIGHAKRPFFAKEHDGVVRHRLVKWRAALFPVWKKLGQRLGIHDGA